MPPPTPLYNSIALADIERASEGARNEDFLGKVPAINDGMRLFVLYVRQSQFEHIDAFDLGMAIGRLLFAQKRLPRLASAFQIFRLIIEFIADGGLSDKVNCLGESKEGFAPPALVLESGRNVLASMTRFGGTM